MAERWQQWMPLNVDRWRGSPAVRAMHPAARSGYLDLLLSQWQTPECALSNDPVDLADASGLGDELWALYGARILRNFDVLEDGRLRNAVCFVEWMDAKRIFEARQAAAINTTRIRSAKRCSTVSEGLSDGDRTVTDDIAPRSPDTITLTGTSTEANTKPSRAKKARGDEPTKSDLTKERHAKFKEKIQQYWTFKNPAVEMPWGKPEGAQLGMWLSESPNTTIEQFSIFLRNRAKSEINHVERPSVWIRNITKFAAGPLGNFGKPINGGNKNEGNSAGKTDRALQVASRLVNEFENSPSAHGGELLQGIGTNGAVP